MKMPELSLLEWQKRYGTEKACGAAIAKYLQEYLDEFCYRFNRRFWEYELPLRLLNACLSHVPTSKLKIV